MATVTGKCGENLTWVYNDETYILTITGEGSMNDYSHLISNSSPWYTYRTNVKQLIIEEGVTSIGNSAFANCVSLTSIEIPDSVTSIGNDAFEGCTSLTSIEIPNSVTTIGVLAFQECTSLISIEIPDGVISIGDSAFQDCISLTSVEIPNSVTTIGNFAFQDCTSLTSMEIPNSVTTIGSGAFRGCSGLTSITISNSVITIGRAAFQECEKIISVYYTGTFEEWKNITIGNNNESLINAKLYIFKGKCGSNIIWEFIENEETLYITGTGQMDDYNFDANNIDDKIYSPWYKSDLHNKIKKVIIGNGVTTIGKDAFRVCNNLTEIIIPNGIKSIGKCSFRDCYSIESCTIPDGVEVIGTGVFFNCFNLNKLTIPNSVTTIGNNAFCYCHKLESITLPNNIKELNEEVFYGCSNLKNITLSKNLVKISKNAFYNCKQLNTIYYRGTLEDRKNIEIQEGNDVLSSDSITIYYWEGSCGESLNYDFNGIDTLTIKGTGKMFDYPKDTKSPWIDFGVKIIEFEGDIESIGEYAFLGCKDIEELTIPLSIVTLNQYCFKNCESLNVLKCYSPQINVAQGVFENCDNLIKEENNYKYIINENTKKYWLINYELEEFEDTFKIPEKIEVVCGGSLINNTITNDKTYVELSLDVNSVSDNSCVIKKEKENKIVEFICIKGQVLFGSKGVVTFSINEEMALGAEENLDTIEVLLTHTYKNDDILKNFISLINYVKNKTNYTFMFYYTTVEEKKILICFKIEEQLMFEFFYIGDKGKLDIEFNPTQSCKLEKEIFSNRTIENFNVYSKFEMNKGALLNSKIVQMTTPFVGGTISGTFDTKDDCNYFGWLYGKEKFSNDTDADNPVINEDNTKITGMPNTIILTDSTLIPDFAFAWCDIKSIELPLEVEQVGNFAFYNTSLTSLDIPKEIKFIGDYGFYVTPFSSEQNQEKEWLSRINWSSSISMGDFEFRKDGGIEFGKNSFYVAGEFCPQINSFKFFDKNGIREDKFTEENYDFEYATGEIKSKTTEKETVGYFSLPYYVFSVLLNEGKTYENFIQLNGVCGTNLFYYLELIENGCYNLKISGSGAMSNYKNPSEVPWHILSNKITTIVFNNKVTTIGDYAFNECSNIICINLPLDLIQIGNYSFNKCLNLTEVNFNKKIETIGDYAFAYCSLGKIQLSESFTGIGAFAFTHNDKLFEVEIVNGKIIGENCFSFCPCLKKITLPFVGGEIKPAGSKSVIGYVLNSNFLQKGTLTKENKEETDWNIVEDNFKMSLSSTPVEFTIGAAYDTNNIDGTISLVDEKIVLSIFDEEAWNKIIGEYNDEEEIFIEITIKEIILTEKYEKITQIYERANQEFKIDTQDFIVPTSLTDVTITKGSVPTGAFSGMRCLEKLVIANDVEIIGVNILWGVKNLKELKIPYKNSHTIMGYYYKSGVFYTLSNYGGWLLKHTNFIERLFGVSRYVDNFYENNGLILKLSIDGHRGNYENYPLYVELPNSLEKIVITLGNLNEVGVFSDWKNDNLNLSIEFINNTENKIPNNFCRNSNIKKLNTTIVPTQFGDYSFSNSVMKVLNNMSWDEIFIQTISIGKYAFENMQFTDINDVVFNSLNNIGEYAFKTTNVKKITIKGNNGLIIGVRCFSNSEIEEFTVENSGSILNYALSNCNNLKKVNLGNISLIGKCVFANSYAIEEIIAPFIGETLQTSLKSKINYSFMWWLNYSSASNAYAHIYSDKMIYPKASTVSYSQPYISYYSSVKLNYGTENIYNLKKIEITGRGCLDDFAFYDIKRNFPNVEVHFPNLTSEEVIKGEYVFSVYDVKNKDINGKLDKFYYFKNELEEKNESLLLLGKPIGATTTYNENNNESLVTNINIGQKVLKLLNEKDYSWKAYLYGENYDVYITDNNTYADGSSNLPKLYLPNNSKMASGQQITLFGEDTYKLTNLEEFSCKNTIFYRQSKGILKGKLNYFNTITGTLKKQDDNWVIVEDSFKESLTSTPIEFTIGSTFDPDAVGGSICIKNDIVEVSDINGYENNLLNEGITITIKEAFVTKGSIDAKLLNVIKEGSKFTTTATSKTQTVRTVLEDGTDITFKPGFYVSTNGYNNVEITIANESLILPSDLPNNTVLVSIKTEGKLLLNGVKGEEIKRGKIEENLLGIIQKGVTYFSLKGTDYYIKDIDKEKNQIIFEDNNKKGFIMTEEEIEQNIKLKEFINITHKDFDTTDLHLTLNHINIFNVEKIKEYKKLEGEAEVSNTEKLYLITTKEVITPTDYEVNDRSLEKEFVLERYSTIAKVSTLDDTNVQKLLVYPDTFYEIKSNCIETSPYYFQTVEKRELVFFKGNEEIDKTLTVDIYSPCAIFSAEYKGDLIWYKWIIQENIENEYITVKEFTEFYNPNIILNYNSFKNNTKYKLLLLIKTKENLEVQDSIELNVNYEVNNLDNVYAEKICNNKSIRLNFSNLNRNIFENTVLKKFIVLREIVNEENTLTELAIINSDTTYFYDYSFNRENIYQYYIVPIFENLENDLILYGSLYKIPTEIQYNLKEVVLVDTVINIGNVEELNNINKANSYEVDNKDYSKWCFKYNTEAKNIEIVTDKIVYETVMKIPTVNKTNRNYKKGTIKAFLGSFIKEKEKLTYRDSIKLQNKFQEFCDNGKVKILRDEIGNVIPVDVTLTGFDYNPHTTPSNISVTFEWTQVGEEKDLSAWNVG